MPARYETIAGWVNEFGWTSGVELGVFDGATHFYLLEHCPDLHLIGIDLWGASAAIEGPTKSGERCACEYCNATRASRIETSISLMEIRVRERSFHEPRSLMVRANTAHSGHVVNDPVDFVFCDGDHSFEGVVADLLVWDKKVRKGGRMIGHDWNMKSVREAAMSVYDSAIIETGDDHLWWVVH